MSLTRVFSAVIFLIFTMMSSVSFGQGPAADADEAFNMNRFHEAIPLYQRAFSRTRNPPERQRILFQIAESYRKISEFNRAERAYDRAIRAGYPLPIIYLRYAEALKAQGKYEEAREAYEEYLQREPEDQQARIARDYCDTAMAWIANPTRWQVENMRRFNSRQNDFSPTYADRRYNVLVFTSDRDEAPGRRSSSWTGRKFSALFYVTQDRRGNWSRPQLFDDDNIINTTVSEGVTAFNERGNVMYFTRCRVVSRERTGCDIYVSRKAGRQWGEPEPLQLAADSIRVMHPTISEDEQVIYFVSDMPGGYGGGDIWMARRTGRNRPFGTPENLGPVINTSGNEMFPWLREDGVLYFSSDGHPGMGGLDIFKSVMVDGEWTTPVNMGYPINSEGDDFGIVLQGKEKRFGEQEDGFITSNRNIRGARGGDDIYSVHLPPILFTLSGTVRDATNLQPLPDVRIELKGTDMSSIQTVTDNRGRYSFNNQQILPKVTYTLSFEKDMYFGAQGRESTVGLMVSTDLVHNQILEPVPEGPILLPEIRYELARHELLPQYQDSLAGLVKTLKENPTIVVELISHTDFRGSIPYNDSLSYRRSRSCVEYIITQGIEPDRIIAVGRGEREPRRLNRDMYVPQYRVTIPAGSHLTEEFINRLRTHNEREAAHQLNRRTEFRIVRTDFVPRDTIDPIDTLALATRVAIAINPDENVIRFYVNENGEIAGTEVIVLGQAIPFIYNEQMRGVSMSLEQAMDFLRRRLITIRDFTDRDAAILEDGNIVDGAEFTLSNMAFGRTLQLRDVKVRVSHDQEQNFMFGRELLEEMGSVSIDRNRSVIVIEIE